MRKRLAASVIAALLTIALAGGAQATTSANLSPSSQTHAHGVQSTWSGSWSGTAPFGVTLYHGDGTTESLVNTYSTSYSNFKHAFYPCTTTTFTQHLRVSDQVGPLNSNYTTATESGGYPC